MLKIRYSITIRNKNRKSAKWYGRIRQDGREKFLQMDSRAEAERWLARQNYIYGEYTAGNAGEDEVLSIDSTPVLAQKRASKAVLTLRECLDRWEAKIRLEGKRETTIATYGRALRIMVDPGMPVTDFGPEQVKAVMASKADLKPATRRFYSKALLSFCDFLREEYGCVGLCEAIPKIKVDDTSRPFWTREEMQRIISCVQCKDKVREDEYKDYFTIMAAIGSRCTETYLLRWEDYVGASLRFKAANTKSRKERVVPVPGSVQERLARRVQASGPMFPNLPRSQASWYAVLKAAMRRAGVEAGGLHTFRKAVSTLLYKECDDIKACSQILGHSAVVALEVYQKTRGAEELRRIVDKDLPKW